MGCGSSKTNGIDTRQETRRTEALTTTTTTTTTDILQSLRESCLKAHNEKREKHNAPPLVLSDELNEMAQKWADHLGKTGKFEHSSGQNAGENLAGHSVYSHDSGGVITDMWYNEIKDYNFNNQGFSMATGHFTQVVWKGTTDIGVGVSKNEKLGMYVFVANYRPPGNMLGSFEQNVQSPT